MSYLQNPFLIRLTLIAMKIGKHIPNVIISVIAVRLFHSIFRNLQRHSLSNFTNLRAADVLQIEALVDDTITSETNSFIDFYCPKCKKPVRFYFFS